MATRSAISSTTGPFAVPATPAEAQGRSPKQKRRHPKPNHLLTWSSPLHLAAGRNISECHEEKTDESGYRFRHFDEDGRKHGAGKPKYRPVRAVLQIDEILQCVGADEIDRERAYKDRSYPETGDDDRQTRRYGKRGDDAVEREGGVEDVQIDEECHTDPRGTCPSHLERLRDAFDDDEK